MPDACGHRSPSSRVSMSNRARPDRRSRGLRALAAAPIGFRVRLVDSHGHLNAERFEADADDVVAAARGAGVERILVPGWNVGSCQRAMALVERIGWIDAAVGVHPHDAAKVDDAGWDRIRAWSVE